MEQKRPPKCIGGSLGRVITQLVYELKSGGRGSSYNPKGSLPCHENMLSSPFAGV